MKTDIRLVIFGGKLRLRLAFTGNFTQITLTETTVWFNLRKISRGTDNSTLTRQWCNRERIVGNEGQDGCAGIH